MSQSKVETVVDGEDKQGAEHQGTSAEITPNLQPALQEQPSPGLSQTSEPVPHSERRGILGRLTVIPEVTNPYAYKRSTKWIMTTIVAFAATTSSVGSAIFYRQ